MENDIETGLPYEVGTYQIWDLASGFSCDALWDGEKWIAPEDFPVDPNWGLVVDYWRKL